MARIVPLGRWRLEISSSTDRHRLEVSTVRAVDLVGAERLALRALRTLQLTDPLGMAWDRWTLLAYSPLAGMEVGVARGDALGAVWTVREPTENEPGRG